MQSRSIDLVLIALFAALIVVLALVPPIPVPVMAVPVTLQTLGVMLAGLILGPRRGALAVLLYVSLALIGLPVLPGGRAGLAVLMGPTGGFLLGMIPGAAVTGWLGYRASSMGKSLQALASTVSSSSGSSQGRQIFKAWLASISGGILVVYAFGLPWMTWVTGLDPVKAALAVLVFIPGDIVKAVVAAVLAQRVAQSIRV